MRASLVKAIKDLGELCLFHTASRIVHEDVDAFTVVFQMVAKPDEAFFCKFTGIIDQVVHHLRQPCAIRRQIGVILRHLQDQLDLRRHPERLRLIDIRQQRIQRISLHIEHHLVRFDPRKIQDIGY